MSEENKDLEKPEGIAEESEGVLETKSEENEETSLTDALMEWVIDELKESGTFFLEKLTDQQLRRVRETVMDLVGLGLLAIIQKDKRAEHLEEIQIVINTLNGDAALAVLNAQNEVKGAFQRVFFKVGGGFFN